MSNHMEQIAKMLGVKIGEEFRIKCSKNFSFRISEMYGLEVKRAVGESEWCNGTSYLNDLLRGALEIEQMPYKPKKGEVFWTIDYDGEVYRDTWQATNTDKLKMRFGRVFKTREEAERNSQKFVEFVNQEPDYSWRVKE